MAESNGEERFDLIDEMVSVIMRFPKNRLASFTCSFGADSCSTYDVVGTKGRIHIEKAYDYAFEREMTTYKDDEKLKTKVYKKADQFAAELTYFSDCILNHKTPEPSAHEGKADVKVIQAILKSLDFKQPIKLNESKERLRHPNPKQMIKRPPVSKPKTVHVTGPRND
jgi:glucose-fructose oxidoreductase